MSTHHITVKVNGEAKEADVETAPASRSLDSRSSRAHRYPHRL